MRLWKKDKNNTETQSLKIKNLCASVSLLGAVSVPGVTEIPDTILIEFIWLFVCFFVPLQVEILKVRIKEPARDPFNCL